MYLSLYIYVHTHTYMYIYVYKYDVLVVAVPEEITVVRLGEEARVRHAWLLRHLRVSA